MHKANIRFVFVTLLAVSAVVLTGILCFGTTQKAFAADPIATVRISGEEPKTYTSYEELQSNLASLKYKTVEVEMTSDWNARDTASGISINKPLVIPTGSFVTLNMNGYMIDRGLTVGNQASQESGNVITVQRGAMLVIQGGHSGSDQPHKVTVFDSVDNGNSTHEDDILNGVITGGSNLDGAGGICIHDEATVKLEEVAIAGCRGQNGGGVSLETGKSTLNLDDAIISGCLATSDGGGIYVDEDAQASINLETSRIDGNYATNSSGGIALFGQETLVIGDTHSAVSDNHSGKNAGGIGIWNNLNKVRDLAVTGNQSQDGAGIYVRADAITLKDLDVDANTATGRAGGIYFSAEQAQSSYTGRSTLWDLKVQNNQAAQYGGIYFDDNSVLVDSRSREITGETTVKDNVGADGHNNLCIEVTDWTKNRESFQLFEGSEVWACYCGPASPSDTSTLGIVQDRDCVQYLHCELAGFEFAFNADLQVIEYQRTAPGPVTAYVRAADANRAFDKNNYGYDLQKAGKIRTYSVNGVEYDLVRGFNIHDNETSIAVFYYSDGLFYEDPKQYNTHLGTLSWTWANAACYLNQDKDYNYYHNIYYNKHAAARQFLADIGCSDQDIYVNDYNIVKPTTDSIGVTIGSKRLKRADGTETGDILIPIAVRGANYEREWVSNVTLGYAKQTTPDLEAMGFASAANQVFAEVEYYLKKYGLEDEFKDGKVKFWVTGYSRAGATANLTSKRLIEKIERECTGDTKSQVYGYTCEAAKGGTDTAEQLSDKTKYYCIHNMVNMVDFVPYVAPEQMGFKRYGVDHYVPGTAAGTVTETKKSVGHGGDGGPGTVTTYRDNDAVKTKTAAYNDQKTKMLVQYKAMDSTGTFGDSFRPYALDFLHWSFPFDFETMRIYENGNYDGNRAEDFVIDFVRFIQDGSSAPVKSRDMYARDSYSLDGNTYPTYQELARYLLEVLNTMTSSEKTAFVNAASDIKDYIPTTARIPTPSDMYPIGFDTIYGLIGNWGSASTERKVAFINHLWEAFEKTGAVQHLPARFSGQFEQYFPTLVNLVFTYLDADYNYKPSEHGESSGWASGSSETMMLLPTFMKAADYILSCHESNVNIAWVRSYDSWYEHENTEYKLIQSKYKDSVPKAFGTIGGKQTELVEGGVVNKLPGDQKIILDDIFRFDNDPIVGEAIYYDLSYKASAGSYDTEEIVLARDQLYRGGIDISHSDTLAKTYTITAYDISYGIKSDPQTYKIELFSATHDVIVWDKAGDASSSGSSADGSGLGGQSDNGVHGASTTAGTSGNANLMAGTSSLLNDGLQTQDSSTPLTSMPEGYRERKYSFMEKQDVSFMAATPSTEYFKTWTVQVLDENDAVVKEDVASDLLGTEGVTNVSADFSMPEASVTYPADYKLRFIANYHSKISKITAKPTVPVADETLDERVRVSFDDQSSTNDYLVTWYFENRGERHVTAGTADEGTVYIATIHIDQDEARDIVFVDEPILDTWPTEGDDAPITSSSITRSPEDGSVSIEIVFKKTDGESSDPGAPDYTFGIDAYDLNTGLLDSETTRKTYYVWFDIFRDDDGIARMKIVAPDVPGERFAKWDFGKTGIKLRDGEPVDGRAVVVELPESAPPEGEVVKAMYKPVLQSVSVNLYNEDGSQFEPAGDGAMPANTEMLVKVSNTYAIHPDNLELTWSSTVEGNMSDPYANYMGTVRIVPNSEGVVLAKKVQDASGTPVESDYQQIKLDFFPSDSLEATFGGTAKDVSYDLDNLEVSRIFHNGKYALAQVVQPSNIYDQPYGTNEDAIRAMLPSTTKLLTTRGFEFDAKTINWTTVDQIDSADTLEAHVWKASGTVELPDNIDNPNNVPLDVSLLVYVNAAGQALAPTATLPSGTYYANQLMKLKSHNDGGQVYYKINGSDSDAWTRDDGSNFYICRYEATPQQIDVGDGTTVEMPAVKVQAKATATDLLESDPVEFQYVFGDVIAPEGKQLVYSGEPQIGVKGGLFYTLSAVSDGVEIDDYGNAIATKPGTYQVKASLELPDTDWWAADGASIRTHDDKTIEFTITNTLTVRWLDGDGSVLDSKEYPDGQPEPTTDKIPTKAATAQYSYTFERWDEGTTEGAVKTYKPVFTEKVNAYKVNFVNYDGSVLKSYDLDYGTMPRYDGEVPQKPATGQATYVFTGWMPELVNVEGDATYTAVFEEVPVPAQKSSLVFDCAGGTLEGKTYIVITADVGSVIQIPAAPVRDGYDFMYWQGSKYYPGDAYTVEGDHAFTAIWAKKDSPTPPTPAPGGGGSTNNNVKPGSASARTGDMIPVGIIAAVAAIAAIVLVTSLVARSRKR